MCYYIVYGSLLHNILNCFQVFHKVFSFFKQNKIQPRGMVNTSDSRPGLDSKFVSTELSKLLNISLINSIK